MKNEEFSLRAVAVELISKLFRKRWNGPASASGRQRRHEALSGIAGTPEQFLREGGSCQSFGQDKLATGGALVSPTA